VVLLIGSMVVGSMVVVLLVGLMVVVVQFELLVAALIGESIRNSSVAFGVKVSKSQKQFFFKLHCPKNKRNVRQNSAL
jgi:hypothetical protein